jgi:cytochrome c-type biogenesis protein CcmH
MLIWIIAALLILLALGLILPSLLRQNIDYKDDRREQNITIAKQQLAELEKDYAAGNIDDAEYQEGKSELEDSLYEDLKDIESGQAKSQKSVFTAIAVAVFVPLCTLGIYLIVGAPSAIPESSKVVGQQQTDAPDIQAMIKKLEDKLAADGSDPQGWFMLGRTYSVLQRYEDAVHAYEKSYAIDNKNPKTILFLADTLAASQQGNLQGRAATLIDDALKIDPENQMGLWLGAIAARQSGDKATALERLHTLEPTLKLDSEERKEVKAMIVELGGESSDQAVATAQTANSPGITLTIELADALKDKVKPEDTVFIYAKALQGPPMPLAAAKKQVKDLPITITLDDSMAMMPQMKLSAFAEVTVGARISLSGQPMAQRGDLFTEQRPVKAGDTVSLQIEKIVE